MQGRTTRKTVSATVMIYGCGFDRIDIKRLEKLKGPVLVITGGEDTGATQAAINFLSNMKEANDRTRRTRPSGCGPQLCAATLQWTKEVQPL